MTYATPASWDHRNTSRSGAASSCTSISETFRARSTYFEYCARRDQDMKRIFELR